MKDQQYETIKDFQEIDMKNKVESFWTILNDAENKPLCQLTPKDNNTAIFYDGVNIDSIFSSLGM